MWKIKVKIAKEWRYVRWSPNGEEILCDWKQAADLANWLNRHGFNSFVEEV